jgi:hypothetical protein
LAKSLPWIFFTTAGIAKSLGSPLCEFLSDVLKKEDLEYLVNSEPENIHYLPATSKESQFVSEQTIEAYRL